MWTSSNIHRSAEGSIQVKSHQTLICLPSSVTVVHHRLNRQVELICVLHKPMCALGPVTQADRVQG
jgi:hypothetical protein